MCLPAFNVAIHRANYDELSLFFWNGVVFINHSQLFISIDFDFHFAPRIERLVSRFPLTFSQGLNANMISILERDVERGEEKVKEVVKMPRSG